METELTIFGNVIIPKAYDANALSNKATLLTALGCAGASLCANLAVGEPASIAKQKLVVLTAINKAFSDVDTVYTQFGCDDCTSNMKGPDYGLLGSSLKSQYADFTCASGEKCFRACVVSAQVSNYVLYLCYPFSWSICNK